MEERNAAPALSSSFDDAPGGFKMFGSRRTKSTSELEAPKASRTMGKATPTQNSSMATDSDVLFVTVLEVGRGVRQAADCGVVTWPLCFYAGARLQGGKCPDICRLAPSAQCLDLAPVAKETTSLFSPFSASKSRKPVQLEVARPPPPP